MLSDCPNPARLRGICTAILNRTPDPSPYVNFPHMYQRRILNAACADASKDSEEEVVRKIQKMWSELEDHLVCNGLTFDIPNGNVVKYAIVVKHDQFIADVARWKVNLDKVDSSDQLTVLDYLAHQIIKHRGTSLESKLRGYYLQLRTSGAKHKSELEEEQNKKTDPANSDPPKPKNN